MLNSEEYIGKKVNLLEKSGYSYKYTDNVCEVVKVLDYDKVDDWCRHLIVKDCEGNEREIREVECVVSPDYTKEHIEGTIYQYLRDNGIYADVYTEMNGLITCVSIDWGDWKHEHMWARNLMEYLGYTETGEELTEENGSDCYSAIHYFVKRI